MLENRWDGVLASRWVLCWRAAGLERSSFDNSSTSFEDHCKREHNMWHYLFFIVLLNVKDPTEYSGPESYVSSMIKVAVSGAT